MAARMSLPRAVPGLALVAALSVLAVVGGGVTARWGIEAIALGLLFGLVVGNVRPPGAILTTGVRFAATRLLAVAVVLLGLRLSLADLARLGLPLVVALGAVVGALVVALAAGLLAGVRPRLAVLLGAGTGVCGISAIAAVRPVVAAREAEMTYAVAAVAVLGSLGLVLFPVVQLAWHPLSPAAFGVLTGGTLHSVPQAVGAGFAGGGDAAGTLATVVKLSRVALLAPLVLLLAATWRRGARGHVGVPPVPFEVWGFLGLVALGSLAAVPDALRSAAAAASEVLLLAAIVALGLLTRLVDLRRAGVRPLLVAAVTWVALVVAAFALLRLVPV